MSARQRLKILDRGFPLPRSAAHRGKLDADVKGADIHTVALLLGHQDLRITLPYQHLSPGFLAEAVAKLVGVFGGAVAAAGIACIVGAAVYLFMLGDIKPLPALAGQTAGATAS